MAVFDLDGQRLADPFVDLCKIVRMCFGSDHRLYLADDDSRQLLIYRIDGLAAIFSLRIGQPFGGFRPAKITYRWQEDGQRREHIHITRSPNESYRIVCATRPETKSIVLELADPQTQ